MNLEHEFNAVYERWLLDEYSDEIHTKENLTEKSSKGYMFNEFMTEITKIMRGTL